MDAKKVTVNGKEYLQIGDKLVEILRLDEQGKPVIKAEAREIKRADGTIDVEVHVPCLQVMAKENQ